MREILVTGGAGFLGSHVCRALMFNEYNRVTFVDDLSVGRKGWAPLTEGWYGDIACADVRVDIIVHCAAHADIRYNSEPDKRLDIWKRNVEATFELTERAPKDAHFIFLSSGAVYGDAEGHHWTRQSPTKPGSLYAASKLAGEAFVAARGFKRWHVLRSCSLLGPRYHHGHVADFVANRRLHRKVSALDSGQQVKDYRDVRDVADIIAGLVRDDRPSGIYNVGGQPWSARDTARVMGVDVDWSNADRGWPGDPLNVRLVDDFGDRFSRPREESVRDTLTSLGWP